VRRRFTLENLKADLRVADAEALPFENDMFDLAYSHGVLHHTPDIQHAIGELHRVLRPEGTAMVMLYHLSSYNYAVNIMTIRRLGVRLLGFKWGPRIVHRMTGEDESRLLELQRRYREDPQHLLSPVEFLTQNTDGAGNPLARVFTKREATEMFAGFRDVRTEVHFLNKRWLPIIGKVIPNAIEAALARTFGWHLWIIAKK